MRAGIGRIEPGPFVHGRGALLPTPPNGGKDTGRPARALHFLRTGGLPCPVVVDPRLGANLARSCVTRLNRMPLLFFSSARGTGRPAGGGSPAGRLLELQWRHHQEVKWTNSGGMCAVPPSPTGLSYLNSCRRTRPNKEMFIGLL